MNNISMHIPSRFNECPIPWRNLIDQLQHLETDDVSLDDINSVLKNYDAVYSESPSKGGFAY